jgi:YD repeat-containing protein
MKRNITAIILVFAILAGFASCKKLENEGEWVVESKVYVTDSYGAQHDVQTTVNTAGETEYYYYNTDGNKVTVAHKDVVVSTTKVFKTAPTTLTPEQQSILEQYTDPDAFKELVDETMTEPELDMSDGLISEEIFTEVTNVEVDNDGEPQRTDKDKAYQEILKGDSFTASFNVSSDYDGKKTVIPFDIAKDKENIYVKTAMPFENGWMELELIAKDKQCYAIIPAMRAYIKVPAETLGEFVPEDVLEQEMNETYVKSGQVEVDGVTYDVDIYDVEGNEVKYYYLNGELKRLENTDGETASIVEYKEVKKGADKSKFNVPAGYIDMTSMLNQGFDFNALA